MNGREPTAQERAGERAFALTNAADVAMLILMVLAAIASGSLTMFSESARGVLLLIMQIYTLWLLRASHRGQLTRFEYGTGKMEQFVFVIVGIGLLVGTIWVVQSVLDAFVTTEPPASPLGLSVAAIVNAINLGINLIGWHAMWSASRGRDPGLLAGELSARFGSLVGSAILQVSLTAAALAKDPVLVLTFDAFGATLVALLMGKRGLSMIMKGLSTLLDQPPSAALSQAIRSKVTAIIPETDILGLRMRRGGKQIFVEVAIDGMAVSTVQHIAERSDTIRQALHTLDSPVDLTLVVGTTTGWHR
ncbi:MAG: cation transporter [Alphaproteobacteria bacterium]|nr:cation transporter [Alphaproteobacteria bacterium]